MFKHHLLPLAILFYCLVMMFHINSLRLYLWDESVYANSVQAMVFNVMDANNHPLLAKTIWLIFVKLSWIISGQDYPLFWRIGTVLLSVGCLVIFYKICRLFFTQQIAFGASIILALDPMFFVFGRSLNLEIPSLFFFLLALYGLLIFQIKTKLEYLFASAIALGLSFAAKISPLVTLFILQVASLLDLKSKRRELLCLLALMFLMAGGYLFGNGYYFIVKHRLNFVDYSLILFSTFLTGKTDPKTMGYVAPTSNPVTWYTLPQAAWSYKVIGQEGISAVLPTQNPLTMFFLLPGLLIMIWKWKRLSMPQKTVFYIFITIYGIYFINIRETYYYYVTQLVPLVILLELFSLEFLFLNTAHLSKILKTAAIASTSIFVILYPVLVGMPAPRQYESLVERYFIYHPVHVNTFKCQDC